jgi:DUF1680 family protein
MRSGDAGRISRRGFLQAGSLAVGSAISRKVLGPTAGETESAALPPLSQFGYGDVLISSDSHEAQLRETHAVLMGLSNDSLLKPFRQMSNLPAPGEDLGGWYHYDPDYDYRRNFDAGFAPACTFGQWISALARAYAITGDTATREKVLQLNRLYAQTISADFYVKNRFPAYTYDKLVLGLLDSHTLANDPQALEILDHTTDAALPHLPGHAVEHNARWRMDKDPDDQSWTWDESYTLPENLFLAYQRGAGRRYYDLGILYLDDAAWFDPLSRNENVLNGRHAYSYVNSLNSAIMAGLVAGSQKHLRAARNGFAMLLAQSYATGGWGPDETLRAPDSSDLYASLTNTHSSFETPCGSYAHFKLTRYLLRVTRDARYGDSMERMMYNTVLGSKPLQEDGNSFYYSDYNFDARRVYHLARWPCCSGTLPQVATDYRINTYFRGLQSVYVNLYISSTLRWAEKGRTLSLTMEADYPYDEHITISVMSSQPTDQMLYFRIPEWADNAAIFVNGTRQKGLAIPGQFAAIRREWKTGDRVELELPLQLRLEPIDVHHPDTVALLRGPLVLMVVKAEQNSPPPLVTREELLSPARVSQREWRVNTSTGAVRLLPFTSIGELPYTTYLKLRA